MQLRHLFLLPLLGLVAACAGTAPQAGPTQAAASLTPQASSVLQRLDSSLAQARSFAFNVDILREVRLESGERANLVSHDTVVARRPDRLRADLRGDASIANVYYDGRQIALEVLNQNLYAIADAPPDINGALDMMQDRLGVPLTLAPLLRTDSYSRITQNTTGDVVSDSVLDGQPVHHLLMTSGTVKWELWTQRDGYGLPIMLITTRDDLRTVYRFSNWRLNPNVPDQIFHYMPPSGAHQIPFVPLRADQRG